MIVKRDIAYKTVGGENLLLNLYMPEEKGYKTLVFFHGGALESGDRTVGEGLAPYLTENGVAVVSVDYRMYPKAKYPEFIEDCAHSVAWAIKNMPGYGAGEQIFVGGSSAGGYLSMMLCFDNRWYEAAGVDASKISGYFHNAGQPTNHFNVLRERGISPLRVMIDDSAPLYHIGEAESYPPMRFIVSDSDLPNRYEQTMLTLSTLKNLGYDQSKISHRVLHGGHCSHDYQTDANGNSLLAVMIYDFIKEL